MVLSSGIKHISSYALTVEPRTALESLIKKGMIEDVSDLQAQEQFYILIEESHQLMTKHYGRIRGNISITVILISAIVNHC